MPASKTTTKRSASTAKRSSTAKRNAKADATIAAELANVDIDAAVAAATKTEPKPKTPKLNVAKTSDSDPVARETRATKAAVKAADLDAAIYVRKVRATGTTVALLDNRERKIIDTDEPWFAVCVDHGSMLPTKARRAASDWLTYPQRWCPSCKSAPTPEPTPEPAEPKRTTRKPKSTFPITGETVLAAAREAALKSDSK